MAVPRTVPILYIDGNYSFIREICRKSFNRQSAIFRGLNVQASARVFGIDSIFMLFSPQYLRLMAIENAGAE